MSPAGLASAHRWKAIIAAFATLVVTAGAVHFIQDEYLWTKGTWSEFRLAFPMQHFKFNLPDHASHAKNSTQKGGTPQGERPGSRERVRKLPAEISSPHLEQTLSGHEGVSLRGAVQPTSGAGIPHANAFHAGPAMETLERDEAVPAAASVIECQVCQHFAETVWQGLVQWLLQGPGQRLSQERLHEYLAEMCHWEVPQAFLRDHIIMEGQMSAAATKGQPQNSLIAVSGRHEEVTKVQELRAVRKACDNILAPLKRKGDKKQKAGPAGRATAAPKVKNDITPAFVSALDAMVSELEGISGLGYKTGRENGIEMTEESSDGPRLLDSCQDHNPGCSNWAKWGECSLNSRFMIGHEEWPGNCRLSCGACQPPEHIRNRFLSERTSKALMKAAKRVVTQLERRVCSEAPPCQSNVPRMLQKVLSNMRAAALGGTGFAADEHGVEHSLQPTRWPASRVVLVRRASEALTGSPEVPPAALDHGSPPFPPEQALARALHDRCLVINAGWWSYELCYQIHLRQFHMSDKEKRLVTINTLGVFDPKENQAIFVEKSGSLPVLPASQLLSGTANSRVPYLRQLYPGGSVCRPATGTAEVPRSTEVRIACSPDSQTHLVVHELAACRYTAILFSPVLCSIPGFVPDWQLKGMPIPAGSRTGTVQQVGTAREDGPAVTVQRAAADSSAAAAKGAVETGGSGKHPGGEQDTAVARVHQGAAARELELTHEALLKAAEALLRDIWLDVGQKERQDDDRELRRTSHDAAASTDDAGGNNNTPTHTEL